MFVYMYSETSLLLLVYAFFSHIYNVYEISQIITRQHDSRQFYVQNAAISVLSLFSRRSCSLAAILVTVIYRTNYCHSASLNVQLNVSEIMYMAVLCLNKIKCSIDNSKTLLNSSLKFKRLCYKDLPVFDVFLMWVVKFIKRLAITEPAGSDTSKSGRHGLLRARYIAQNPAKTRCFRNASCILASETGGQL